MSPEEFENEWLREIETHMTGEPRFTVADAHSDWHANNEGSCPWDCLRDDYDDSE